MNHQSESKKSLKKPLQPFSSGITATYRDLCNGMKQYQAPVKAEEIK